MNETAEVPRRSISNRQTLEAVHAAARREHARGRTLPSCKRTARDRSLRRFHLFNVGVAAIAIGAGLASPCHVWLNAAVASAAVLGIHIAMAWCVVALVTNPGFRKPSGHWLSPVGVCLACAILWLGVSEQGFMLRFHWSRAALEEFVVGAPCGEAERYAPRWVGCLHVGGVRKVGDSVLLYVSNGLYHEIGIARMSALPPLGPKRPEGGPFLLVPALDPPWYFVSYE